MVINDPLTCMSGVYVLSVHISGAHVLDMHMSYVHVSGVHRLYIHCFLSKVYCTFVMFIQTN